MEQRESLWHMGVGVGGDSSSSSDWGLGCGPPLVHHLLVAAPGPGPGLGAQVSQEVCGAAERRLGLVCPPASRGPAQGGGGGQVAG